MGGVSEPVPSGHGGRKPVNVELNLVPFIDLLVVCITFLLLTAVWTQTGRINIDQSVTKPQQEKPKEPPKRLIIMLDKKGYTTKWAEERPEPLLMSGGKYPIEALLKRLEGMKENLPEKPRIVVAPEDSVEYKEMIAVMDSLLSLKLDNFMVADAASVASEMM